MEGQRSLERRQAERIRELGASVAERAQGVWQRMADAARAERARAERARAAERVH